MIYKQFIFSADSCRSCTPVPCKRYRYGRRTLFTNGRALFLGLVYGVILLQKAQLVLLKAPHLWPPQSQPQRFHKDIPKPERFSNWVLHDIFSRLKQNVAACDFFVPIPAQRRETLSNADATCIGDLTLAETETGTGRCTICEWVINISSTLSLEKTSICVSLPSLVNNNVYNSTVISSRKRPRNFFNGVQSFLPYRKTRERQRVLWSLA